MKKLMTIFGAILFASVILTSCGGGSIEIDAKKVALDSAKLLVNNNLNKENSPILDTENKTTTAAFISKKISKDDYGNSYQLSVIYKGNTTKVKNNDWDYLSFDDYKRIPKTKFIENEIPKNALDAFIGGGLNGATADIYYFYIIKKGDKFIVMGATLPDPNRNAEVLTFNEIVTISL